MLFKRLSVWLLPVLLFISQSIHAAPIPIYEAARNGDFESVETIVSKTPFKIDNTNTIKATALHYAAYGGHHKMARFLISRGADVKARMKEGRTPLHLAALQGDTAMVNILLEAGAEINVKDSRDFTPLYLAVDQGHADMVKLLISKGADVNLPDSSFGISPLCWALYRGYREIAWLLIRNGADPVFLTSIGAIPLHFAARQGYDDLVLYFLKHGSNIDQQMTASKPLPSILNGFGYCTVYENPLCSKSAGATPLLEAIANGQEKTALLLIAKGADVNIKSKDGMSPLVAALLGGMEKLPRKLIAKSADFPLSLAVRNNDLETTRKFLARRADVNAAGSEYMGGERPQLYTSLVLAAYAGHAGMVRLLIANGVGANRANKCPSALDMAYKGLSNHRNQEVIELLIRSGDRLCERESGAVYDAALLGDTEVVKSAITSDPKLVKSASSRSFLSSANNIYRGETLLHRAVYGGHTDIVSYLIDHGANINVKTKYRHESALHLAAYVGHADVVKLLIEKGADIRAKDDDDQMPLHRAAANGHTSIVRLLLEHGANIDATDDDDQTPLHRAAATGHTPIVRLLLEHGANIDATDEDGSTPLFLAVKFASMAETPPNVEARLKETIALLLRHGADSNLGGPLNRAVGYGRLDIAKVLVEHGAKIGEKILFKARSKEMVDYLVAHGANVNARDYFGRTVLSDVYRVAVAEALIRNGADPNILSNNGRTVLDVLWDHDYSPRDVMLAIRKHGGVFKKFKSKRYSYDFYMGPYHYSKGPFH